MFLNPKYADRIEYKVFDMIERKIFNLKSVDFISKKVIFFNELLEEIERDFENIKFLKNTGIKDCNGKSIFENDIVRNKRNGKEYIVTWIGSAASFELKFLENERKSLFFANQTFGNYEKIGNIYENNEVLEG